MKLNATEKFKIRELQNDPVFMGILNKLCERHGTLPLYNPAAPGDSAAKHDRYVYRSGYIQGVQFSCELLGLRNDTEI